MIIFRYFCKKKLQINVNPSRFCGLKKQGKHNYIRFKKIKNSKFSFTVCMISSTVLQYTVYSIHNSTDCIQYTVYMISNTVWDTVQFWIQFSLYSVQCCIHYMFRIQYSFRQNIVQFCIQNSFFVQNSSVYSGVLYTVQFWISKVLYTVQICIQNISVYITVLYTAQFCILYSSVHSTAQHYNYMKFSHHLYNCKPNNSNNNGIKY